MFIFNTLSSSNETVESAGILTGVNLQCPVKGLTGVAGIRADIRAACIPLPRAYAAIIGWGRQNQIGVGAHHVSAPTDDSIRMGRLPSRHRQRENQCGKNMCEFLQRNEDFFHNEIER